MLPTDRIELTETIARIAIAEMLKTFPLRWGVSYRDVALAAGLNITEEKKDPHPPTYKTEDFEGGWQSFIAVVRSTLLWLADDGLVDLTNEGSMLFARPTRQGLRLVGKDILCAQSE